ncbi:hypothetical protein MSAN_02066400 [Mycena sanguinolenta]|uniref:Uncharacterized protein n=1 Tax=Mycena sanguinolenta TaxID=230812 RepID=A0A8H7CMQ0_9AGAR|nr:hypothetical protein MSAN_02066400 [Mycena sanguinolenta]
MTAGRARAIAVFKTRTQLSPDDVRASLNHMIEAVKGLPIIQENFLKYEVSIKSERPSGTLASELGLQETEFSAMVLMEAESQDKIHKTLTDPGYRKLLAGALEHFTEREHFHFFPAEVTTVIDK